MKSQTHTVGILGYGTYIPRYRLSITDIASVWQKDSDEIISALGVKEKAVPNVDEDAVTVAIEATLGALHTANTKPNEMEAVFVGSESHPYAVNPTSTIVGELVGMGHNYLAADLEFACKAGTAGIQMIAGLISSGQIHKGIAIGADTAQSRPHDALEYTSATAGAAFVMGVGPGVARLEAYTSYSSDTPDFWRRDGIRYPSHAGRFTGEPAYFTHVMGAATLLMEKTGVKPSDVTHVVFHMPNGKFPRSVAKRLGFTAEQLRPSLTVDHIGNPYSASAMLGFGAVLDASRPGDRIFMVSYGSGAGSDAFLWEVGDDIVRVQEERKRTKNTVHDHINRRTPISYAEYLKKTHKI
jgi:hydroxymethylglutaryl-CoA synthase